jgi:hypothetical protein
MRPTKAQAKAKAQFHANFNKNPLLTDLGKLSQTQIRKLAKSQAVVEWLKDDEFKTWFFDPTFNKALIESGVQDGIEMAIRCINTPVTGEKGAPKWSDQLSAFKLLLDYGGYAKKSDSASDSEAESADDKLTSEERDRKIAELMKKSGLAAVPSE